ncbi:mRNA cap guanine-n7 methyltransferase [Anaeramoeba ignava]|uniref:mRNA (guanine-N(7))-methyltransferase n=1 Tax=Anaeramoeba ignava TaxID=1746090 RepID=A0A9Q0LSF9_ANAIG|nr:mRNA cap guanine-n7 methyltransferase [Anaeramoeba ignava]
MMNNLNSQNSTKHSQQIQNHYDQKKQINDNKRKESPIIWMKTINNWVKSILIKKYTNPKDSVLDFCCGKGGDLKKWKYGLISNFVGADISKASIHDAIDRNIFFDIVSCQFSLHYSFQSESTVRKMLENVTCRLSKGGFFVGTVPNANWIVKKLRSIDGLNFGNDIFSIKFIKSNEKMTDEEFKQNIPTFGAEYEFSLLDAIKPLSEFLIHFPSFEKIASEYGLKIVEKRTFHQFFYDQIEKPEGLELLQKMSSNLKGEIPLDQWEAIGIYMIFVFEKVTEPSLFNKNNSQENEVESLTHEYIDLSQIPHIKKNF